MIAGLPNNIGKVALFVLASTILLALALPGLAEDVQTSSTTLDDVLTLITQNEYLSPMQETLFTSSLTAAVTSGALTPDQALALVDLSGLESVTDATQTSLLTHALSILFDAVASGDIDPDQASTYLVDTVASGTLSSLKDLAGAETPTGVHTAISQCGAHEHYAQEAIDAVLAKVDQIMAADVPPGIALRVARELIRAGLEPTQILAELDSLAASITEEGTPPGKTANAVTSKGQNPKQDMNQNNNQGKSDKSENGKKQNSSPGSNKATGKVSSGSSGNGNGSKGNSGNAGNKGCKD